jgi:signal transduction histidine kinase
MAEKLKAADREFLSVLTQKVMQTNKPDAIVEITMQHLARHLSADRVGISELTRDRTGFLTRAAWSDKTLPPPPQDHPQGFSPDLINEMCTRGPFVVDDVQTDPRFKGSAVARFFAEMDVQGVLNIPVEAVGENPVFLFVHSRRPRLWQPREVDLCQQVVERLWNTVHRAQTLAVRETAEDMLGMALSVAKLGAIDRDFKSGTIRVSDGFLQLIGHSEMASGLLLSCLGIEYLSVIHPEDQERFATKVEQSVAKDENNELDDEHRIITGSGETRHIAYKSRFHFEADAHGHNKLTRITSVVRDITEEKQQAAETAQAQDRLLKMSRLTAMGTMASTLAHELNQPLTAATNYLNVLRTLDRDARALQGVSRDDVLDLAMRGVLDAGQIIKKMRTFTSGGGLQRTPVSLATIAGSAAHNVADPVGRRKPEITLNVPKRLMVDVDAMQIEQVLANLLRNATEAMTQQKAAKITLTAREQDGFVDLHVIDNGPGIPDDFADGLFNPFQSSKQDGMGLGLSLCRTMVEAHGGHLTLEKHDSTGCDFLIRLPKTARRRKLG